MIHIIHETMPMLLCAWLGFVSYRQLRYGDKSHSHGSRVGHILTLIGGCALFVESIKHLGIETNNSLLIPHDMDDTVPYFALLAVLVGQILLSNKKGE